VIRYYIIIPVLFLLSLHQNEVLAQQTPISEMYLVDYFYANPAATGLRNCLVARFAGIQQWIGIKEAPNMQIVAAHKSYKKEHKSTYHGLGGVVFHDQNGHYQAIGTKATYAFHILLNPENNLRLSFGIAGEYTQTSIDQTGFINYNSDPAYSGNRLKSWNPNGSVGILLSNNNFFSGLAVLDLVTANNTISGPVAADRLSRKYSLFFGRQIAIAQNIIAEPSFMLKTNELLFSQADLNTKILISDICWLGISYRHTLDIFPGRPLCGLFYAGIIIRRWSFDYSFAFNIGSLQRYHYGTHGITISYKICSEEKGAVPCPAYR
jgi:type IX secretion system PorP/SprF family membrane protein